MRGDRADLYEAETDSAQYCRTTGVLVESGCQPERPGEVEPKRPHP